LTGGRRRTVPVIARRWTALPILVVFAELLALFGGRLLPPFPGLLAELLALLRGHGFAPFAVFILQALALFRCLALPLLANLVPHLFPFFRSQGG